MKQTYEHDTKIDNFYDNINKNIADSHNYLCDKYNNDIKLMFLDAVCTAEDSTVKGYSTKGIAERILSQLKTDLPLDEMCEEHEIYFGDVRDSIEYALEELGIC